MEYHVWIDGGSGAWNDKLRTCSVTKRACLVS